MSMSFTCPGPDLKTAAGAILAMHTGGSGNAHAIVRANAEGTITVETLPTGSPEQARAVTTIVASRANEGEVTVPAGVLERCTRHARPDAEVQATMVKAEETGGADWPETWKRDDSLDLRLNGTRYRIQTVEMPQETNPEEEGTPREFELRMGDLLTVLGRVTPWAGTEETRGALKGVYFEIDDDHLVAVATNGEKMAQARMARPPNSADLEPFAIHAGHLEGLRKALPANAGTNAKLRFTVGATTGEISWGPTKIIMPLRDLSAQPYPDYAPVIGGKPGETDHEVSCNASSMREALETLSAVHTKKVGKTVVELRPDGDELTVRHGAHGNEAEYTIAKGPGGWTEPTSILMENLEATLKHWKSETMTLVRRNEAKTVTLREQDGQVEIVVVMALTRAPVRV